MSATFCASVLHAPSVSARIHVCLFHVLCQSGKMCSQCEVLISLSGLFSTSSAVLFQYVSCDSVSILHSVSRTDVMPSSLSVWQTVFLPCPVWFPMLGLPHWVRGATLSSYKCICTVHRLRLRCHCQRTICTYYINKCKSASP